jgi:uncharacterized coiled-coil protein SlyX
MTKEQEAQQAQTIAECRQWHEVTEAKGDIQLKGTVVHAQRGALLEIVDSQAQKIAEQAKEIERLKTQIRLMEYRYNDMGDLDYNEPNWLARIKSLSPDGKP